MSCSSLCYPECGVAQPAPVSGSCNEPCVTQCPDSVTVIYPSAVDVILPGVTMTSFPQSAVVSSVEEPGAGARYGASMGLGGLWAHGGLYGSGALCGIGGRYPFGGLYGCGGYCRRYPGGYCGPC